MDNVIVKTKEQLAAEKKAAKAAFKSGETQRMPSPEQIVNASLTQQPEQPKQAVKDESKTIALVGNAALAAYNKAGVQALPENVVVSYGDTTSSTHNEAKALLQNYVRAKVLSLFGVKAEKVNGQIVKHSVKPLFINDVCRPLKLEQPAQDVKTKVYLETPQEFVNRQRKNIMLWLVTSVGIAQGEKLAQDII